MGYRNRSSNFFNRIISRSRFVWSIRCECLSFWGREWNRFMLRTWNFVLSRSGCVWYVTLMFLSNWILRSFNDCALLFILTRTRQIFRLSFTIFSWDSYSFLFIMLHLILSRTRSAWNLVLNLLSNCKSYIRFSSWVRIYIRTRAG